MDLSIEACRSRKQLQARLNIASTTAVPWSAMASPNERPSAGGEPPSGIAAPLFDAHHDCLVAANEPCPDCASTRALWTYFELDDLPAWALREIEQGLR